MTPVEQAAAVYDREPCARSFKQDLELHLLHGLVYSTPTAFVMARYVSRDWPDHAIVDPRPNDLTCARKSCIHVYLAAGDIREIFNFPHEPCDWISFERSNILRFYPYQSLKRRWLKN